MHRAVIAAEACPICAPESAANQSASVFNEEKGTASFPVSKRQEALGLPAVNSKDASWKQIGKRKSILQAHPCVMKTEIEHSKSLRRS